ncbi:NAD(P)/FAD-dependent oxidoreductase [Streptomyces millisiae]|uniref:Ferredoxin--NADP reductase n=1 Tax=Streptomyces millisiae TaxID=3075542 RepID=A0ABU2LHD5_9ACTN|nr:NAD(P)/FAD-dependent oxidoreductase [Streptomyces sp. DSM 44918]MDT0317002.1 NAD(P)/FAD-dependent oxidoreductase [Streptomyces sp. DSM 44918]
MSVLPDVPTSTDAPATIETDVLIVGAGPAGLYGAYYAGFRGLRVAVIDVLPQLGGQVSAMYPEKPIFDIAGLPAVRGRDLVANLVAQAEPYGPHYLLGQRAVELSHGPEGRPVVTSDRGTTIVAGAVVITGGVGTFTPRPLPAGEAYLGRGQVYFVPDPAAHAGEDVVVVGGGDSAFDWAATLFPVAGSVTLVHRTGRFRAHRATVEKVTGLGVEIVTDSEVSALHGASRLQAVEVRHRTTGATRTLPAHTVVAALGFVADLGPIQHWGLALNARRISVDTRMATNLPRVFAAGDITDYPGKVRLISVGFGEVATAVNNAATVIDPEAALFPGHSTEKEN